MTITPISYKEAASLLGVNIGSLSHAVVDRKVLTRLPRDGQQSFVIAEQVKLFKNKRLSLKALNEHERKIWEDIDQAVKNPQQHEPAHQVPATQQATQNKQPVTFLDLIEMALKAPLPENIKVHL